MLMYCALRVDGYRYQQETDFDYQTALSTYMSTGDWSPLNELEQLTVFFMLQRYLYSGAAIIWLTIALSGVDFATCSS